MKDIKISMAFLHTCMRCKYCPEFKDCDGNIISTITAHDIFKRIKDRDYSTIYQEIIFHSTTNSCKCPLDIKTLLTNDDIELKCMMTFVKENQIPYPNDHRLHGIDFIKVYPILYKSDVEWNKVSQKVNDRCSGYVDRIKL